MELGFLFSFFIYFLTVSFVTPAPTQTANSLASQFLDQKCSDALQQSTSSFINKTFTHCGMPFIKYYSGDEFPRKETFLCVGIFRGYSKVCEILKTDKSVLSSMEEAFKASAVKPELFCSKMANIVNNDIQGEHKDLVDWILNYNEIISDSKRCSNFCSDDKKTVSYPCRAAYSAFIAGQKPVLKMDKAEDPVKAPEPKVSGIEIKMDSVPKIDESSGTLMKPVISDAPLLAAKVSSGGMEKPSQTSAQPDGKLGMSQVPVPPAVDKSGKSTVGPKEPGVVPEPNKLEKTLPEEGSKPPSAAKPVPPSDSREESPPRQTEDEAEDTAALANYPQTSQYSQQSEKDAFQAGEDNFRDGSSLGLDETPEFEKKRGPGQVQRQRMNTFDSSDDTNFLPYFLLMVVMSAFGYVAFHNKNKLIALVVEGRRSGNRGRSRSRHGSTLYSKLHSNLEETISSNSAAPTASHVLY